MGPLPSLAVVIPTHDRGYIIGKALKAIEDQSYAPIEIVVVDDGSTDGTAERLAGLTARGDIVLVTQQQSGAGAARNRGALATTAEYLVFLDSDDTAAPMWLERLAVKAEEAGRPPVVCCGFGVVIGADEGDMPIIQRAVLPETLWYAPWTRGCFDHAGTFAVRSDIFAKSGGFREGLPSGQINEFGIRLTSMLKESAPAIACVDECLVNYYPHRQDNIRGNISAVVEGSLELLRLHKALFEEHPRQHADLCGLIGVRLLLLGRASESRIFLWRAVGLTPLRPTAWMRAIIALMPPIGRRIWRHLCRASDND